MTQIKRIEPETEQAEGVNPLAAVYVEEATTSPEVNGVTDNADFSKSFTLKDGKRITLRDIKAKDLLELEEAGMLGNLARAARLTELLTVEYGEQKTISAKEIGELGVKDLLKLSEVIASFFE